jgi:ceramide glucosyltransferase
MIHSVVRLVEIVALLGCLSSAFYYLLCWWSAGEFLRQRKAAEGGRPTSEFPPVSILKPLKGVDPEIYESFRSHCLQEYPEFEIIFGVSDPADPAIAAVKRLQQEFPHRAIRLVLCPQILGANVKVSNLEQMLPTARYECLLVNDSDIRVEPGYLQRVIPPLTDDDVGMVTCLYRGVAAATFGSRVESLGISTDFSAGVLVAQRLEGGLHFGLGSTMAFRRSDLERFGGFHSIVDFLADDYELGSRIAALGLQVRLSEVVVETHLPAYDLRGFLAHQLRWARGIRDSRLGGYIGLASTFGLLWGLLAVIFSHGSAWSWAALAIVAFLRLCVAIRVASSVLQDRQVLGNLWLIPFRDLLAVAIWVASFAGHKVSWRGDEFELKNGRLVRIAE